jgi:hypothetical protein
LLVVSKDCHVSTFVRPTAPGISDDSSGWDRTRSISFAITASASAVFAVSMAAPMTNSLAPGRGVTQAPTP